MVKKNRQHSNKLRTDDVLTRKQKRKEERINKKKRRAMNPESRKHTLQEDDEEVAPQLIEIKEPKKKKKKTKKTSSKKDVKVDDPYDGLDPDTVAAMKRDDEEIAELEAKLGIGSNSKKDKEKLNKEYAKLEGYGNDFGHFLDDLDGLVGRINDDDGDYPSDIDDLEYDSDESDLAAARAKALIRMEAGGVDMENSEDESSEDEKMIPMKAPASEEDSSDAYELNSNQLSSDEESEDGNDKREETSDNSNSYSSNDENDSSDESSQSEVEDAKDHDPSETYRPIKGQDLYGNSTDQNKNQDEKPTKYIPPHLRKKMAEENNENTNSTIQQKLKMQDDPERKKNLLTIQRSLNNTLNRLSDNTLESVAKSIVGIYNSNPSQDVNDCYWKNISSACLLPHMVMSGLIPVYIACVTGVHFQTGDTVQLGGHILEKVISTLWDKLHEFRNGSSHNEESVEEEDNAFEINKETSNIMLLLCYMYNFSAIHCTIIYDVVRDLIQSFTEQDVELLLLILKHCGYQLRSDDPTALKEIVLLVQERALQKIDAKDEKIGHHRNTASNSRVQYMLGAITDLKNNKKKKNDDIVGEKISLYRRAIGRMKTSAGSNRSNNNDTCLRITLKDILEVESKGRWWKVGASWVGNQFRHVEENTDDMNENNGHSSIEKRKEKKVKDDQDELLILAAKQRMNSDDRRAIFCIIMGSDDCEDAFEKLVKTGMLKGKSDRDVALVLLHCCGQEKTYNPYYAHLASRICEYQSKCAFTFKLTYFDVFKQFDDMKARKAANLAKLLVHLIAVDNRMNMTVLKAIEISTDDMPDSAVIFLTIFFSNIFLSVFEGPEQITDFFERAIPDASTNMKQSENMADEMIEDEGEALRESLSVFLIKYLKPSPQNKKKSKFSKNLKAAIKACEADRFESMFMM